MSEPSQTPLPLRVRLPYATEDDFIARYGSNVARGGVFVATRSVKPEGTLLQFEFVLAEGGRLLRGEGVVVRAQGEEEGKKAGMTIRFTRLDAQSKALVDRIVAFRSGQPTPEPPEEPPRAEPPPAPAPLQEDGRSRGTVLGIDVGTRQLRGAVMIGGRPQLIPLELPAVVARDQLGRLVVGDAAEAIRSRAPSDAIDGPKRLLGRRARSTGQTSPAPPSEEESERGISLRGKGFTPAELLAPLLTAMQEAASAHMGHRITHALLCAPASFTDHQRSALLDAGRLAGLEVLRIVNEPAAVALAYGHGRGLARKRVLTYSLGATGFEASVVEITGDDLEVIVTGSEPLPADLSLTPHTPLPGGWIDQTVTRAGAVLAAANLTAQNIDALVLVGGGALSPEVRRRVEEALGHPAAAATEVDPLNAVAQGAAILGDSLRRADEGKRGATVSDILGLPIGIALRGGGVRRVLERGTRLPAEKTLTLPVQAGVPLGIAVVQGESERADDNAYLGALQLQPDRSGEAQIVFQLSVDGTVQVAAQVPGERRERLLATEDAPDDVRAALFAAAPLPDEPEPLAPPGGLLKNLRRIFGRRD